MAENEDDLLIGTTEWELEYNCVLFIKFFWLRLQRIQTFIQFLDLTEFVVNIDSNLLEDDQKAIRRSLLKVFSRLIIF